MTDYPGHFTMNGTAIITVDRYRSRFSVTDLLRCRHMAAGFFLRQMAPLSPWDAYHSKLFFDAVYNWDKLDLSKTEHIGTKEETLTCFNDFWEERFLCIHREKAGDDLPDIAFRPQGGRRLRIAGPDDYFRCSHVQARMAGDGYPARWNQSAKTLCQTAAPACAQLLDRVWHMAAGVKELSAEERARIFLLISAGYMLARKTPDTHPADAGELYTAWLGRPAAPQEGPQGQHDGSLAFPARQQPYPLAPVPSGAGTGGGLIPIRLKKLVWAPSLEGNHQMPVRLALGDTVVTLEPHEYCYVSFLEGQEDRFIRLYPLQKTCGDWTISRAGGRVTVTHQNDPGRTVTIPAAGRDIVDLAVDGSGRYLLLEPGHLDSTGYSGHIQGLLQTQNIVQIDLREGRVWQLNEKGHVFVNGERLFDRPFAIQL